MLYEQIQKEFLNKDLSTFTEDQMRIHQKELGKVQALVKQCFAATSKPKPAIDDVVVVDYINKILSDGFNLQSTAKSANRVMLDVQHVKSYRALIKLCVQNSAFSEKAFKVRGLHKQRNNIENSTTLHELRQAIGEMIPVLKVIRELTAVPEASSMDFSALETESLLEENARLTKLLEDKERVVSEVLGLYNDDSIMLPKKVTQTMKLHSCSEVKACSILGISRTSLNRAKQNSVE